MINNYTECNNFEIRIIDGKVKIYYYDRIEHFGNNKITVLKNNKKIYVKGKKLIIETMFKEFIIISGDIDMISFGNTND